MIKGVELEAFGHEHVLEERGCFENILEGLGEPVFDKEVLG